MKKAAIILLIGLILVSSVPLVYADQPGSIYIDLNVKGKKVFFSEYGDPTKPGPEVFLKNRDGVWTQLK